MLKKLVVLMIVALLLNVTGVHVVSAASKEEKRARFTEKVRVNIAKLGTGTSAVVKVDLRDKSKIKGYISSADAEAFTVIDPKTGVSTAIPYSQVKGVKGNNLSTGVKIAIGVGIAAAVIIFLIVFHVVVRNDD